MTDARSSLAMEIQSANPDAYQSLVVEGPTPDSARQLLGYVKPEQLLRTPSRSSENASAMLAGLWLWHDGLHESHTISQALHSATGSFWHAIMHRREGDFSNSKYWYARCQGHPALAVLANQAGLIVNSLPADNALLRIVASGWNPSAFVDFVQSVYQSPNSSSRRVAVELQRLEWNVLFQFCSNG
jgi:hypothetical protein